MSGSLRAREWVTDADPPTKIDKDRLSRTYESVGVGCYGLHDLLACRGEGIWLRVVMMIRRT